MAADPPGRALVTGGSGYLGQFVVQDLARRGWKVGFTYNSGDVPAFEGDVAPFKVNLATGEGLQECFDALAPLDRVINCAANTSPAACETDVEGARAVNIPTKLLDALDRHAAQHGTQPFLVHLSTDHVYDGASSWYKEDAELRPVNAYGRSKVDAEQLVRQRWPQHAILRSSIIYGPPPPHPVRRGLFLQFIDGALASKTPTTFFEDEWRTPTYVLDLVRACDAACQRGGALQQRTLNLGGPERLNRVDMARTVAATRGYNPSFILLGSAQAAARNVATPADISMDCSAAERELGVKLTRFEDAVRETFGSE